jgi:hypothetical protein
MNDGVIAILPAPLTDVLMHDRICSMLCFRQVATAEGTVRQARQALQRWQEHIPDGAGPVNGEAALAVGMQELNISQACQEVSQETQDFELTGGSTSHAKFHWVS